MDRRLFIDLLTWLVFSLLSFYSVSWALPRSSLDWLGANEALELLFTNCLFEWLLLDTSSSSSLCWVICVLSALLWLINLIPNRNASNPKILFSTVLLSCSPIKVLAEAWIFCLISFESSFQPFSLKSQAWSVATMKLLYDGLSRISFRSFSSHSENQSNWLSKSHSMFSLCCKTY